MPRTTTLDRSRLPDITPGQWNAVGSYLREPRDVEPHDLANHTGLSPSQAMALILCLDAEGCARTFIKIYHSCEHFEMPCGVVPFKKGTPSLPWHCKCCGFDVEDAAELAFAIVAQVKVVVLFR